MSFTLNDRVAQSLRDKIVQGEYAPGQRLSEAALSEDFEISRNTLREVFRLLTSEGLLHHTPNRGVSVVVPTLASIIDIYRVRRVVECQSIRMAYSKHPGGVAMRQAVQQACDCRDKEDWLGVGTANMVFHKAVVELADSERLNVMFSHLLAELRLAFGLIRDANFLHHPFVDQNLQLLQLFEEGKLEQASAYLNDYLIQSERIILAAYARLS